MLIRRQLQTYLGATLAVLPALLIGLPLSKLDAWNPYLLFGGAVMLSAWYGGLWPGLLTTTLSTVAISYFFLPPLYSLEFGWDDIGRVGTFLVVALLIGKLIEDRKRARQALQKADQQPETGVQERTSLPAGANARLQERLINYRRAVEVLQESEERFRILADTAPVMIWMSNSGKICNYFNRVWLDFTGRSAEQEKGDGWTEGVHPGDLYRCLNTALMAFDARRDFTVEYRLRRFDGEYRWVLDTGVPRFASDGSFAGYVGSCIDITDQKNSEETLRKAESKYRSIFENAMEGIFQIKPDGCFLTVNPAFAHMFGYDSPEDLVASVSTIAAQLYDDPQSGREFMHMLRKQPVIRGFESQNWRKNGSKIWTSMNVRAVHDADNAVLHYEGTIEDISGRKRAEGMRSLMAAIIESSDDAILSTNLEGNIVSWNKGAEGVYGYSAEQAIGQPLSMLVPPDDIRQIEGMFESIGEGKGFERLETERLTKDNRRIRVSLTIFPVRDAAGKLTRIATIERDITESKQAEEALRASDAKNRALLAAIPDLMLRIRKDGTLLEFVSSSVKGPLLPRTQALGKNIGEVLPPEVAKLTMRHAELVLQTQQSETYEFTLPFRNKVHAFEARIVFCGKDEVLAILRDISELKRTEQALRHFADRLATAQEDERRRISQELHDEAGQTLTAITVRLHMLERQLANLKSAPPSARKELIELCELAQSTQQNLRSLAHVLHPSVLEHLGLAEALRSFIRGLRASSDIKFYVYIPRDFPRFSLKVESAIYRIVQEAVMNAFRHARAESISLRCTAGDGVALIAIRDDGRGFGVKRAEAPGTVGLISMRERAEMIGAKLDIRSLDRQGTLVTLCLPLQVSEQANETLVLLLQR
jgi:PAS domain S-box-containing protein